MTDNNKTKVISLIGMAKKAGKLLSGTDRVVESVREKNKNGVKLLLCSADASQNTVKRISNTSSFYNIPFFTLWIDKNELARVIGSDSFVSVIGITDAGFCKAMTERLQDDT